MELRKHIRISLVEKFVMERTSDRLDIALIDHECQVYLRSSLTDHVDVCACDCLEKAARHSGCKFQIVADNTNDCLPPLDRNFADLAQILGYRFQVIGVIERYRYRNFRRGHNIDRRLMTIENFEDRA